MDGNLHIILVGHGEGCADGLRGTSPVLVDFQTHSTLFDLLGEGGLAGGVTLAEIADFFSCSEDTIERWCKRTYGEGFAETFKKHSGKELEFEFTSGGEFPQELSRYAMVVHCGGCMLNEREMQYRLRQAADANVPITNYGTAIAHMNGILGRSLEVFK